MVRDIIQKSGLPRSQIARDAGLSRAALEAWMAGTRTPEPESVEKLAAGIRKRSELLAALADRLERAAGN